MKQYWQWSFILTVIFVFLACNYNGVKQNNTTELSLIDTARFKIDTLFKKVEVDGQKLSLVMMRAKLDEHIKPFDSSLASPITLAIFNDATKQPLYLKTFESEPDDYPFVVPTIFKPKGNALNNPGPLLFSLDKGYGGSGASYQLYLIQYLNNSIHLLPLFKGAGELIYPYFTDKDNRLLLFEGIWNMEDGESHFSKHVIQLTSIDFGKGQPITQFIGKTVKKYQVPDSDTSAKLLIDQLKQNDLKILDLAHF